MATAVNIQNPRTLGPTFDQLDTGKWIMMRGHTGDDVKRLQERLIALGYDLGPQGADGVFGSETEKALKAFQQANKAALGGADAKVDDGLVGQHTYDLLFKGLDYQGKKATLVYGPNRDSTSRARNDNEREGVRRATRTPGHEGDPELRDQARRNVRGQQGRDPRAALNGNGAEALKKLEQNENFKNLNDGVKQEVRDAIRNAKNPAVQARIAELASMPGFRSLSAVARKQILELATKTDDSRLQGLLTTICNTDKFSGADDRVKNQVIELLTRNPAYAGDIDRILKESKTTNEALKSLGALEKSGPSATGATDLEKNENFRHLNDGVKEEVRGAMKGKPAGVQARIADLASQPYFKALSAAERRQVLEAAANGDPAVQSLLQTIVGTDKFARADDGVKRQVMELLARDPRNAGAIERILREKSTTGDQLSALEDLAKNPAASKDPRTLADLENNKNFKELNDGVKQDVRNAMQGKTAAAQARIAQVASGSYFRSLSADARKAVLAAAVKPDADMQALLKTITDTDRFANADDGVKAKVIELLQRNPKNAAELNRILRANKGTDEAMNALTQLGQKTDLDLAPTTRQGLEADPNFQRLNDGVKADVNAAIQGKSPDEQARIIRLASQKYFGSLSAVERRQLLDLAGKGRPGTQHLLEVVTNTDKFASANDRVKRDVMEKLAENEGNAEAIAQILLTSTGTQDALDRLAKLH